MAPGSADMVFSNGSWFRTAPFVSHLDIVHVPTDAFIPPDKSQATVTTSSPFFQSKLPTTAISVYITGYTVPGSWEHNIRGPQKTFSKEGNNAFPAFHREYVHLPSSWKGESSHSSKYNRWSTTERGLKALFKDEEKSSIEINCLIEVNSLSLDDLQRAGHMFNMFPINRTQTKKLASDVGLKSRHGQQCVCVV